MIKHITDANIGIAQLEREINSAEECSTIYLDTALAFDLESDRRMLVGANVTRGLISIKTRDLIIDGQGNKITFRCTHPHANDVALLHITQTALGVELRNLAIDFVYEGENTVRKSIMIRNNAYGVKVSHCKLCMTSRAQMNMTVIQNDRRIDTVFDREGDNFVVEDNDIRIYCEPTVSDNSLYCCGIYNDLPNSMELTNNYIYLMIGGVGERQRSVGIFNNGRYVRMVNNNIKANGLHMEGKKKEHTHVIGLDNEGDYLLFASNNCVAEWAGKAIGLQNKGSYCSFTNNKFIGTHAIHGISVLNKGGLCTFTANLMTSTSRNPRLLVNIANNVNYYANILQGFFYVQDARSGCGMMFLNSENCNVVGNQIFGMKNCGIFTRNSNLRAEYNNIETQNGDWLFRAVATETDQDIASVIDEGKIKSVD